MIKKTIRNSPRYCYLVEENKECLQKYPKKPKIKIEFTNSDDKEV